jgi:hypothetical protein
MRNILSSLVLAPAVLAAFALAPNAAKADATLNVPFNFTVDGKVCPAGQYTVRRDPIKNMVFLRSEKAPVGFHWFLTPGDDNGNPSKVTLRFDRNDRDFALETVQYGRLTTHKLDGKSKHTARQMERIVEGQ